MNRKFNNILSNSDCIDYNMLKNYAGNNLSEKEMHYVEMHVTSCQMCNDELDGILLINNNDRFDRIIDDLNLRIAERVSKKKPEKKLIAPWVLRLSAAVVVLLLISTFVYVSYFKKISTDVITENVKEKKEEVVKQVKDQQKQEVTNTSKNGLDLTGSEKRLEGDYIYETHTNLENNQLENDPMSIAQEEIALTDMAVNQDQSSLKMALDVANEDTENLDGLFYEKKAELEEEENLRKEIKSDRSPDVSGEKELETNKAFGFVDKDDGEVLEENEQTATEQRATIISTVFKNKNIAKKSSGKKDENRKPNQENAESLTVDSKDKGAYKKEDSTIMSGGAIDTRARVDDNSTISGISEADTFSPIETDKLPKESQDDYSIAETEYNNKNFEIAIEYFEKVLLDDPQHYHSLFYAAVSYMETLQPKKALVYLDKVLMVQDGIFYEEAKYRKSIAYIEDDQPAKAKLILDEIIETEGKFKIDAEKLRESIK